MNRGLQAVIGCVLVLGLAGSVMAQTKGAGKAQGKARAKSSASAPATQAGPVKMLEAVELSDLANAPAPLAEMRPYLVTDKGVSFQYIAGQKNALDISTSLSGWKESDGNLMEATRSANTNHGRLVFDVPADNYSAMHVLAYSTGKEGTVPRMTVRIGHFGGGTARMEDTVVNVPGLRDADASAAYLVERIPVKIIDGQSGWISHLRVPMACTANVPLSVKKYDVEFTRDVNVHLAAPAPSEFVVMPAGAPSGVVVLAVTMERSPVQMEYTTAEAGNIFNEGQAAVFDVKLTNRSDKAVMAKAMLKIAGPGTGEEAMVAAKSWTAEQPVMLAAGESKTIALDASPKQRGWYSCRVAVEADGQVLQGARHILCAAGSGYAAGAGRFAVWRVVFLGKPRADGDAGSHRETRIDPAKRRLAVDVWREPGRGAARRRFDGDHQPTPRQVPVQLDAEVPELCETRRADPRGVLRSGAIPARRHPMAGEHAEGWLRQSLHRDARITVVQGRVRAISRAVRRSWVRDAGEGEGTVRQAA